MNKNESLMNALNLTESDFIPRLKQSDVTNEDLLEALNILADIVLAESEVEA